MSIDDVRAMVGRAIRIATPPGQEDTPGGGLTGALAVVQLAQQQAYRFVVGLRGEGTSWREAADLLSIPWSDDYARPERAYELVLGPEPDGGSRFRQRNVYWRCAGPGGCGAYIADHGPYNGHPVDNETGHTAGCRRHAAEGAAYEREAELREQRDQVADEAMARLAPPDGVADTFAQETVRRARWVIAHGGRYQGWSTSETIAVALALRHDDVLNRHSFSTRDEAADRVFRGMGRRPQDGAAWLATVRAAATGETD